MLSVHTLPTSLRIDGGDRTRRPFASALATRKQILLLASSSASRETTSNHKLHTLYMSAPPPFRCSLMCNVLRIQARQEHAAPAVVSHLPAMNRRTHQFIQPRRQCRVSVVRIVISEPGILVLTDSEMLIKCIHCTMFLINTRSRETPPLAFSPGQS